MRILVATGGGTHSEIALRQALIIQEMTGGELTVLTVVKDASERPRVEAGLAGARQLLAPGQSFETREGFGKAADVIVEQASGYDLLVLGERRRHRWLHRLLVPTAFKVLAAMPCPVLIARGEARPLRRVLVCESGRDPSLLNRLLGRLAPLLQAAEELTVLHIMSQIAAGPRVPGWELRADAAELMQKQAPEGTLLEADLERLARLNVRLEAKVRHGLVVREIVAEARSGDYDLVVIGAHRAAGWERFLLDDLARQIIADTRRPLLVV